MQMSDVDHTHPHTDEAFGDVVFVQSETVAVDGGERPAEQTMADVDHTPPTDSDGVDRVYERGMEARNETV